MADRYWVGGSGTWDTTSTARWSATSGGASGASAPTSADNVFFDGASASGNYTVTISGTVTCLNISVAKATAGTLGVSGGTAVNVSGSWTSVATGVTWSTPITFVATSGTYTVTTGGLSFGAVVQFNGAGGTWQLQDNLTTPSTLALFGGTLDLNGRAVSCNFVSATSSTARVLAFGTGGTITCPNTTGGFVWNGSDSTGFSWTGTGGVNFTYAGGAGTRVIAHGSTAGGSEATKAPPFNITAGTDIIAMTATSFLSDVNFTGFGGTVTNTAKTVYGNLTVGSATTFTSGTAAITFAGTSGTKVITTNGRTMDLPIIFNGAGSTFQLGDNYTGGATTTTVMGLTAGTLDLNGKIFSIYSVATSGSGVRGVAANGGSITLFGNGTTIWNGAVATNATFTGLTLNCTYSGSTGTRGIALGTLTEANSINVNVSAGADTFGLTGSARNLNFTGFSGTLSASARTVYGDLTFSPTMIVTPSASVTTGLASTSGTKIITTNGITVPINITFSGVGGTFQLADNLNMWNGSILALLTLTGGTIDLNNRTLTAAYFSGSGATVRGINFGSSGAINLTSNGLTMWQFANASNFTYTGTGNVNFTYASSGGIRTINHGTLGGSFPANLPPPFNFTGGIDSISLSTNSRIADVNFTGFSGTLTNTTKNYYGNVIFSSTMTVANGALVTNFLSANTQIFDTANIATRNPVVIGNGTSNGTVILANALTLDSANTFQVASGTFNANSQNVSAGLFLSSGNSVRAVDISNITTTITGSGNVWNTSTSTNLTLLTANSNIVFNNASGNPTFYLGSGLSYDNIVIGGTGTATVYPTGNITINTLSSTKSGPQTLVFNGNATNYTTVNNYNIVGDASNTVTLTSDSTTPFNIVYGGSGNVNVSYHTISYSTASPANEWYALLTNNNADGGNNTGWIFTTGPEPASNSNFFLVF